MARQRIVINPKRGQRLKQLCVSENITLKSLAESIPISVQYVSNIVNGKAPLTERVARRVVELFPQYQLWWLMCFDEWIRMDKIETMEQKAATDEMSRSLILNSAIVKYGTIAQMEMAIEEMSELTKAICKYKRALVAGNVTPEIKASIIEEMADVQIMLDQMKLMFGPCWNEENKKLARLAQRLGL